MRKSRTSKDDARWREQLTPEQFRVLRRKGTEAPFSGEYVHTKDDGIYRCAACDAALFSSETKFDSGTGWPSFTDPAVARERRAAPRPQPVHAPHRGHLRELRRPPRPRVQRRPAGRRSLLHQLGRALARHRRGGRELTRHRLFSATQRTLINRRPSPLPAAGCRCDRRWTRRGSRSRRPPSL